MLYFCSKRFLFGCVLARVACMGFTEEVSGQVKHYFQGAKTGDRFNRSLGGYGDANISSPFSFNSSASPSYVAHSDSLNHDLANFATLTTGRKAILLVGHGGDVRVKFNNISAIAAGTTTYVRLNGPPVASSGLGSLLNIGGLGSDF